MKKTGYVYIIGNQKPVLYVGVTSDLVGRIWEHKNKITEGYSKKYSTHKLLYFEECDSITDAIDREKQIKHWKHSWKLELIKKINPTFKDLYDEIIW